MKILRLAISVFMMMATGPTGMVLAQHWGYKGEASPAHYRSKSLTL